MFRILSKRLAAAVGVGAATVTTGVVLKVKEQPTEAKPINGLNAWWYTHVLSDEKKRRQAGIVPSHLSRAAQIATAQGDKRLACEWYKKMAFVSPLTGEMAFYNEAAEFLFANDEIEEAVTLWEKCATEKDMPLLLEKAGNACQSRGMTKRAVNYWEKAQMMGYDSKTMLTDLSHYYTTSRNTDALVKAENTYKQILAKNPLDSTILNELGVVLYMRTLIDSKNEKFDEQRIVAIDYFEQAVKADPTNEIAAKNLDIAKMLDGKPYYGTPNRKLQCHATQSTFMYDAILDDLTANRYEHHSDIVYLPMPVTTYDEKGQARMSVVITPTVMPRMEKRVANENAINEMKTLKLRWDEDAKKLQEPEVCMAPVSARK